MTLDIVLFALIAIFLGWRLYAVLGQRIGLDKTQVKSEPVARPREIRPPAPQARRTAFIQDAARPGIDAIQHAEPDFDPEHFVHGAKSAYDMVTQAFAQGDRTLLQSLLTPDLFRHFDDSIKEREAQKKKLEFHLIGINRTDIVGASLDNDKARIEVRFTSQHSQAVFDAEGNLLDGDPKQIDSVTDLWAFVRKVGSSDPNWQLAETHDYHD